MIRRRGWSRFKVRIAAPANVPQADIHVTVNELVLSPALASDDRLTAALDSPLPYAFFDPGVIEAQVALAVGRLSVGHADFEAVRAVLSPRAATSSGKLEGAGPGGQFTLPRDVLRAVCNHFYDMPPETTGDATFCCGGGGGLLTDDLLELRVKGARPRMQALHDVVERHDVTHMVAICAICKSQFAKVMPQYGFGMDQILSLHQLVGDALVLGDHGR